MSADLATDHKLPKPAVACLTDRSLATCRATAFEDQNTQSYSPSSPAGQAGNNLPSVGLSLLVQRGRDSQPAASGSHTHTTETHVC